MVNLLCNLEVFDLEERKQVRDIILEVYLSRKELMEPIFANHGPTILQSMLSKYGEKTMSHFVGPILRIYTSSPILVKSIC